MKNDERNLASLLRDMRVNELTNGKFYRIKTWISQGPK